MFVRLSAAWDAADASTSSAAGSSPADADTGAGGGSSGDSSTAIHASGVLTALYPENNATTLVRTARDAAETMLSVLDAVEREATSAGLVRVPVRVRCAVAGHAEADVQ